MKPVNLLPERHRPRTPTGGGKGSSYILLGALGAVLIAPAAAQAATCGSGNFDAWLADFKTEAAAKGTVEAIEDPAVQGVTCHVARFSRGVIDRLTKGNWFEDPSNASIACRQTGPSKARGSIVTPSPAETQAITASNVPNSITRGVGTPCRASQCSRICR